MSEPQTVDEIYSAWLRKILDKHARQEWESDDADLANGDLEEAWHLLPEILRRRLWGLSADLFSLVDNEKYVEADAEPLSEPQLLERSGEAFQARKWDEFLELLRRPPSPLPAHQVSYLRARAWQHLGEDRVAFLFFDNAARLEPGNVAYPVLALDCLKSMGDWDEALTRATRYSADPTAPPVLLFRAGDVFHAYAVSHQNEGDKYLQEAIHAIDRGFLALGSAGAIQPLDSVLAGAFATKAFSLEQLGRWTEALAAYNHALQRFPRNPELLTARGLLYEQQHNAQSAIGDFQAAVENSAHVVWPYLELARHFSEQGDNDRAVRLCQGGLALARRDTSAALLLQWLAIALFKRRDATQTVEQAFQEAMRLDPFNVQIQENYRRFKQVLEHPGDEGQLSWVTGALPTDEIQRDLYEAIRPGLLMAA